MTDEQKNPVVGPAGLDPTDRRAPRTWNVITVPEGTVGKPRKKPRSKNRDEFLDLQILPPNWITYASCKGAQAITLIESTWEVPQGPGLNDNQLLFLFNGLQNTAASQIFQPILQWGSHPSWGGGPSWFAMPLFVDGTMGDVHVGPAGLVPVASGTPLTGYVRMTERADPHFVYECGFAGMPQPPLVMQTDMMVEAVEVLEAYNVVQPADYPPQPMTTFSPATMGVNGAPVHPVWAPFNRIVNNHQHTIVWPDGHVDIHYGAA